jgi:hypothetical protein
MTHIFQHPKYYKELRKRNKSDQVISSKSSTEQLQRAPGSGHKHQAPSVKLQASSKPEPSSGSEAASGKPQASSGKLQT